MWLYFLVNNISSIIILWLNFLRLYSLDFIMSFQPLRNSNIDNSSRHSSKACKSYRHERNERVFRGEMKQPRRRDKTTDQWCILLSFTLYRACNWLILATDTACDILLSEVTENLATFLCHKMLTFPFGQIIMTINLYFLGKQQ